MYIDANISLTYSDEMLMSNSIDDIVFSGSSKNENSITIKTLETIAYSLVDGFRVFALDHKINDLKNLDKKISKINSSTIENYTNKSMSSNNNSSNTLFNELNKKILNMCSNILLSNMTPTIHIDQSEKNISKLSNINTNTNGNNTNSTTLTTITKNDYRLLTRATFDLKEKKDLLNISNIDSSYIDLIAVQIHNDSNFEFICVEVSTEIIQISSKEKINFYSKKKNVLSALKRGLFFEFNYKELLNSETRSFFIYNFSILNEILKGKNIIISSGVGLFVNQRSPYDVITCFETIFNIDKETVKTFITSNPETAIRNGIQRKFYKGIVKMEKTENKE